MNYQFNFPAKMSLDQLRRLRAHARRKLLESVNAPMTIEQILLHAKLYQRISTEIARSKAAERAWYDQIQNELHGKQNEANSALEDFLDSGLDSAFPPALDSHVELIEGVPYDQNEDVSENQVPELTTSDEDEEEDDDVEEISLDDMPPIFMQPKRLYSVDENQL